jgi:hypothetical protein
MIVETFQDNGVAMSFPSIRRVRSIGARNAAEQVGGSRTWPYRVGAT